MYNPTPLPSYDGGPAREPAFGPDRSRPGGPGPAARHDPYGYAERDRRREENRNRQAPSSIDRNDPRTADEKPCRTLFIRNIDNSASSDGVRDHFARYGEIKTFFDLISKRGICFITYFDLRGAEWAKGECHAVDFPHPGGRKLDVHYSLPKDMDTSKRCDRDQNQGTLFMLLKRVARTWTDADFRNEYSRWGMIKSIRRYKDQKNARFLEFYDSRACVAAHDARQGGGKEYIDPMTRDLGEWDVKFAWDAHMIGKGGRTGGDRGRDGHQDVPRGQPPPPPPHMAAAGRAAWSPGAQLSASYGGDSGYASQPPPSTPGSNYGSYGGPPPREYAYPSATVQQAGAPHTPASAAPYGTNPYGASPSSFGPPSSDPRTRSTPSTTSVPPPPGRDDSGRLEQAQKVQQLLASLGSTSATSPDSKPAVRPPPWEAPSTLNAGSGAALPANVAQILANTGGGDTPSGSAPAGTANGNQLASEAQQSIAKMLEMLKK